MRLFIFTVLAFSLTACALTPVTKKAPEAPAIKSSAQKSPSQAEIILAAEGKASPNARKILFTLRNMIDQKEIIKGGCWDYLDAAFTRAGIARTARKRVFDGTIDAGPYAQAEQIEIGDWIYYINHSYGDIEHSGIFVDWLDRDAKQAIVLSYAGEQRQEPARYRVYDLSHVYRIVRP